MSSPQAALFVAPGDRVRIGDSDDEFRYYTVAETATQGPDKYWIALTLPFSCGNYTSGDCGAGKTVRKSLAGVPSFAVRDEVYGRDVYAYDVYFTGPHLADALELEVVNEATGDCLAWEHRGGRARDARASTPVPGGSMEVQTLTLAAETAYDEPKQGGEYFALFVNHYTKVLASTDGANEYYGGACFDWGVAPAVLEERIVDALNMSYPNTTIDATQIAVSRSGFGDGTSEWGEPGGAGRG